MNDDDISGCWFFADSRTGLFTGRSFSGPRRWLQANTPAGCIAIEGVHDVLCKRVDLASGAVIDWQPPQPSNTEYFEHRWDDDRKRWIAHPTLAEHKRLARAAVAARIAIIEGRQARALRELALADTDGQLGAAKLRLVQIDESIGKHRKLVADIEAAADLDQVQLIEQKLREAPPP